MKKKLALILFLLFAFVGFSRWAKPTRAQSYCATDVDFPVCINLDVPGNAEPESMENHWPLVKDACWKFGGVSNKYVDGVGYKLQVKVEDPTSYEGQLVTPVDFVKNHNAGYWGPYIYPSMNLRWFIVDFDQSLESFMWAAGDKRYDRHSGEFLRRFRYDSLTPEHPPYILMPQNLSENPENSGLTNSTLSRLQYYLCEGSEDCILQPRDHHSSWFMGVTNAQIRVPYTNYEWVDAKRVEFVELSLPGKYGDGVTDPYSDDRDFVCRMDGEILYYSGVREDWFFIEGMGIALILTREVGLEPDNECVYEVARENLTFDNADTYAYLIQKDFNGYDPEWDYSPPPFCGNGSVEPPGEECDPPGTTISCTASDGCPGVKECSSTCTWESCSKTCENPSHTCPHNECSTGQCVSTYTCGANQCSTEPDCWPKGDLDHDGTVDADDIKILLSRYFTNDPEADLNDDGVVNGVDYGRMVGLMQ